MATDKPETALASSRSAGSITSLSSYLPNKNWPNPTSSSSASTDSSLTRWEPFFSTPKSMTRLTSKVKFIFSDHYDFIGLETYAGHAPGFFAWIEIKGLAVPDEQILLPLDDRKGKYGMRWIEVSLLPMLAGLSHRL